jgi:hypothetical protein
LIGKTEELAGVMQQRYGYGKAQAHFERGNVRLEWVYPAPKVGTIKKDLSLH